MRINQIGITIYDNKPNLPANRWYETSAVKEDTRNRFKIELNFLHKGLPIKLRSTLCWPPRDLRRLSVWQNNVDFYENIRRQADDINTEIRSGRISAQQPALLALPNMNESFITKQGRTHFKWICTEQPSAIIAVKQMISSNFYQWKINWMAPGFKQEFILDQKSQADEVPGRRGTSTRVYKAFPGPHMIDDKLITADYTPVTVAPAIDEAYEEFKRRVQYLYSIQKDDEAKAVLIQFPEYTERWMKVMK